jgi:hypothetical protein
MIYTKNLSLGERALRADAGLAMIACGLLGLPGLAPGYAFAAAGLVTLLTGFLGFCPMCALASRKLPSGN